MPDPEGSLQAAAKYDLRHEVDVLNTALFGMTAKQWWERNPGKERNIRDYADIAQPIFLSNLENLNALFITGS